MANWQINSEDRSWYVFDANHENPDDLFVRSKAQAESLAATLNRYEKNYDTLVVSCDLILRENKKLLKEVDDLKIELERLRVKT